MKALIIAILLAASSLHADANQAKAAYMAGAAKEKAGNYDGAISDYQAALKAFPGYVYANKQLGNCYYRQGKTSEALAQYDIYLARVPSDQATKKFADAIRAKAGAAPANDAPQESSAKKESGPGLNPTFYMGFGFGMLSNDGSDLTKGSPGATASLGLNFLEELHLGYQFPSGFAVEGGYQNFNRLATITTGSSATAFVIGDTTFFVEPFYRFQLAHKVTLDGGLQLGYTSASLTFSSVGVSSSSSGSSALALSGSGISYMPEARINFILGRHIGLDLGVGYRIATITVKGTSSSTSSSSSSSSSSSGDLNDGGLRYGLGLNIFFGKLVN